ncbi:MAG: bifunctional glutamate N-acetyltransferase/amino-acid acetyltransferase ArgJ [Myxococcota bacterium]
MKDALPQGFLAAGRNLGIKNSRRDVGILLANEPAVMAACVSDNRSRASCVSRTERIRSSGKAVRAILAVSGNANALNGEEGPRDDALMAKTLAESLGVEPDEILTAYTGVIGYRLPADRLAPQLDKLLPELVERPHNFAESLLTTDRSTKLAGRELFIAGHRVRVHGVAKGAGMIAPSLATTLAFITTDACVDREVWQQLLQRAVDDSFNQLTVDGDMSTNDQIIALASGRAGTPVLLDSAAAEALLGALTEVCLDLARQIADDGDGATRRIEVCVDGPDRTSARALARSIAGSVLVKAAVFGADHNAAARVVATAGATAARLGITFDPQSVKLVGQDIVLFEGGRLKLEDPTHIRRKLAEPVVELRLTVGDGAVQARAIGCDLTYDYVKINADYSAITHTSDDGRVKLKERLAPLGPSIKKKLLIEALGYIDKFRGMRAVIKLGGQGMVDPRLEDQFADDVRMLRAVGLLPIVVHGGVTEITRTLERMGRTSEFVDGFRVTDHDSMAVVEMVLTGAVNQRLVAALNRNGYSAVGLSGKDGGLIRARRMDSERDLGQVGEVESVDVSLLGILERDGYIPVISPVGLGVDGQTYNLNSDVAAAELARGLGASKLIFLGDDAGVTESDRVVSELTSDQLKRRLDRGEFEGPLKTKLGAVLRALAGGVSSVHLVDGRVPHNLIAELFTDTGVGTLIRRA